MKVPGKWSDGVASRLGVHPHDASRFASLVRALGAHMTNRTGQFSPSVRSNLRRKLGGEWSVGIGEGLRSFLGDTTSSFRYRQRSGHGLTDEWDTPRLSPGLATSLVITASVVSCISCTAES